MGLRVSPGLPLAWADFLRAEHTRLERLGLRRSIVTPDRRSGVKAFLGGREYVLFTSNDYLGLSAHPQVIEAANDAANCFGAGSGAARLLHGSTPLHEGLQEQLARLTRQQAALLFSSGYMASLGLLSALAGRGDVVFHDERSHASIIDGVKLSQALAIPYPHNDVARLEELLREGTARRRIVVTESVFSMDGDLAPLEDLINVSLRHDALPIVDEAHAIGVAGLNGSGLLGSLELRRCAVVLGTLSKSLGSIGGFVAGDETLVDYLIDRARTFIFDTALPASAVAAASAAVDLAREESWRRERITEMSESLRVGLDALGYVPTSSTSQIVPLILGKPAEAVAAEEHLRAHGVLVRAVRPPSVPRGTSRLRFSINAGHEGQHVHQVVQALESLRG